MRRICFLTGKRGGFEAMVPTLDAIEAHPDMDLRVIVTDQHLQTAFGRTLKNVRKQARVDYIVDGWQRGDSPEDRANALGRVLENLAKPLQRSKCDCLLLIGDRGESVVAGLAAHTLRIPIAHVQGGDLSGGVDDAQRHALSKLAHLHFASTKQSAARLLAMGEQDWRVHVTGDPHVDQIVLGHYAQPELLIKRYNLPLDAPFLLMLQHPDTLMSYEWNEEAILQTCIAVATLGLRTLVSWPCTDQHHHAVTVRIEKFAKDFHQVSVYPNIPAKDWLGLLRMAGCLVGNSSSGIIEAPYFGTPVVNIGDRQRDREGVDTPISPAENSGAAIAIAIKKALGRPREPSQPFGPGDAYIRITEILAATPPDARLLNKRMTY